MQKIEKNLELAIAYKKWIDGLEKKGKDHPTYSSSNHRFYYDIIGNLLWVQKGLCAYTEMFLIDPAHIAPENWAEGKAPPFKFMGQLDHYDSTLKPKKGWQWENFFVVHSDVNVKVKAAKSVNSVLKPDSEDFDPFYFLEYDFKTHNFLPCRERDLEVQRKILEDINTLGLNFQPIIDYRKKDLAPIVEEVQWEQITLASARKKLKQFYTAFEMSIRSLDLTE